MAMNLAIVKSFDLINGADATTKYGLHYFDGVFDTATRLAYYVFANLKGDLYQKLSDFIRSGRN